MQSSGQILLREMLFIQGELPDRSALRMTLLLCQAGCTMEKKGERKIFVFILTSLTFSSQCIAVFIFLSMFKG